KCPRLEKLTSTQIKFVRLNIRRRWLEETTFLPLREGKSQRVENAAGNLILNGKDVLDLAIEPLGPKMIAVLCFDQLDHDPQTVSSFTDAALKKRLNAETLPNLARVYVGPAKREA